MKANKTITTKCAAASSLLLLAFPAGALASDGPPTEPVSAPSAVLPATQATAPAAPSSSDGLVIGVDTVQTVETKLGRPMTVRNNSDGTTMLFYTATKTHVKGATFIPFVGLFAGGAKGQVSTKIFIFDAKGVLSSTSSSETNVDCHIGFSPNCH